MKVLLIDDHPLILSALQNIIQGLGDHVSVVAANSAKSARDTLKRDSDFDLALLDLRLGDADGFDVLAEFRAAYPAMPVVVVSASDRTSDVIRAIDLRRDGLRAEEIVERRALRGPQHGDVRRHLRAADEHGRRS